MSDAAPTLTLDSITKRFGSVVALNDVSLTARPGTVRALLGENGAGKTTLMRIAFGMLRPDAGTVKVNGTSRTFRTPADAIAAGIGMVHQHFSLVPAMTVAENVALGGRGGYDARRAIRDVERVSHETGLMIDPVARVESLSVSDQQRAEIVKALAHRARLLILDEPTAVLAPAESSELLAWLRRFADGGASVVLITHKLRDALAIADDVSILRRGELPLSRPIAELTEDAMLLAMLGEAPAGHNALPSEAQVVGDAVIVAREAGYVDDRGVTHVQPATFEVHAGEIVGIAAVERSGQHELLRMLAGRLSPTTGAIGLPASVGFIPEDRHRDGLVMELGLHENVALRGAGTRRGRMPWRAIGSRTRALLDEFDVIAAGATAPAASLSGGNQQKLVLARELGELPKALIAENPTRGLDVRAAAAVLERLRDARKRGVAVVCYSSDLDDVLALADRMLVVYGGRVRETSLDRDAVGRAMLGGTD